MPPAARHERRRIHRGRTLAERQAARSGVSLRGVGVSQRTENRYLAAVAQVLPILEAAASMDELDPLCEEWVEHQWEVGTPLGTIGDALCGLHFFWPQVKGYLKGSWKLYKNWRRIEVPQCAPPLPRQICLGLIGYFLSEEECSMAFLVALGYHAFLRTGELLKLTRADITMGPTTGVVVIRSSKSGLRFNMDESVALYDIHLSRLWELCLLQQNIGRSDLIWSRSGTAFRDRFHAALGALAVGDMGFQPYSIRRGGATHSFATSLALDRVILRGRWRSLSVARIYLEDGQAQLSSIRLSSKAKSRLATFSRGLPPELLP